MRWRSGVLCVAALPMAAALFAGEVDRPSPASVLSREKALEAYLKALHPRQHQTVELGEVLEQYRLHPRDARLEQRLHELVAADSDQYFTKVAPMIAPIAGTTRATIVADSYRVLLRAQEGDCIADNFSTAIDDYERGRLLSAMSRLLLIRQLDAAPGWMQDQIDLYTRELLPRAMETKLANKPEGLREPYGDAWRSLSKKRWPAALQAWKVYLARYRALSRPGPEREDTKEIRELAALIFRRSALMADPEKAREQLEDGLALAETSPAAGLERLDPLLFQIRGLSSLEGDRARAGYMWAWSVNQTQAALARLRDAYRAKQFSKAVQIVASILSRDPKNAEALRFVEMMDRRQQAQAASAAATTAARARPVKPASAAVPAPPRQPTLSEQVQSMAHYNRGIVAYSNHDLAAAAQEWKAALDLDPGSDKARHALERARLELAGTNGQRAP